MLNKDVNVIRIQIQCNAKITFVHQTLVLLRCRRRTTTICGLKFVFIVFETFTLQHLRNNHSKASIVDNNQFNMQLFKVLHAGFKVELIVYLKYIQAILQAMIREGVSVADQSSAQNRSADCLPPHFRKSSECPCYICLGIL